jgi:hypothetical protein
VSGNAAVTPIFGANPLVQSPEEISSMVLMKMKETDEVLPWRHCYKCGCHGPHLL